ncbi:MAG: hypothetical protein LBO62_07950 [Endomicrobium sp.]|jgi:hypothetical protein|nr:hypothetical protein [Endomicrobium sp.]
MFCSSDIGVIYLAWGKFLDTKHLENFFTSYEAHPAGIKHTLIIATKSFDLKSHNYKMLSELSKKNNA